MDFLAGVQWSAMWYGLSPLLGVLIGGLITYRVTSRSVQASILIARDGQVYQSQTYYRNLQLDVFRDIHKNLWRVAMYAAEAASAADEALNAAKKEDRDGLRAGLDAMRPWQQKSRDTLHAIEVSTALLGDEPLRKQLDALRETGMKLTTAFADKEKFDTLHESYTEHYELFRENAAENVQTILMGPIGQ